MKGLRALQLVLLFLFLLVSKDAFSCGSPVGPDLGGLWGGATESNSSSTKNPCSGDSEQADSSNVSSDEADSEVMHASDTTSESSLNSASNSSLHSSGSNDLAKSLEKSVKKTFKSEIKKRAKKQAKELYRTNRRKNDPAKIRMAKYIRKYEKVLEKLPKDFNARKRLGIAYHHMGTIEKKGMPEKSVEMLAPLLKEYPNDNEVRAFLGSAKTMIARDSYNPFTKLSSVREGTKLLDEAIKKSPNNITVRLARANNSLYLPRWLGRADLAEKDLLYIAKAEEASKVVIDIKLDPEFGIDPDNSKKFYLSHAYYRLGVIYLSKKEKDVATTYLKKTINVYPDSPFSKDAKKILSRFPH